MDKFTYLSKKVFNPPQNQLIAFTRYFLNINKVAIVKNKTILDIGCGLGIFLIISKLIGKTKTCWGIDQGAGRGSKENILDILQKNVKALELQNFNIRKGDIFSYDFKKQKFDVITAFNSLHHIIETDKNLLKDKEKKEECIILFKKVHKLLNNNGIFIIQEISSKNLKVYKSIISFITKKKKSYVNYKTKHSSNEYKKNLKKAGFKKISCKYLSPLPLGRLNFLLSNPLGAFLTNSPYLIFAYKN